MRSCRRAWSALTPCVALVVMAACQTPQPQSPGMAPRQSGQPEKTRGRTAVAADATERDVLPRTHYAAGRLHESQNQINRAIEQYQAAVTLDPQFVEARNGLATCLTRLGSYRQAEEQFVKAIELAPDKPHLRNNLAFCYISQRRWADAEAELRNALELKPEFVRARINLGLTLAQQNKFDGALEAFRAVLNEEDAQFNMGLMYQSVGRYADAGKAFRTAIERNPRFVAAKDRLEKVRPLMEKAEREEAAKAAAQALAAVPTTRPIAAAEEEFGPEPLKVASATRTENELNAEPAHAPVAEPAPADEKSEPKQAARQASPLPRVPVDVLPAARQMVVALTHSLSRAVAAGAAVSGPARTKSPGDRDAKGFVVTCDATAETSPPEDLDVQDNLWLGLRDPHYASEEAGRVGALEEGIDIHRQAPTNAAETRAPDRADLTPLTGRTMPSAAVTIGATLLPDDPFQAFPHD